MLKKASKCTKVLLTKRTSSLVVSSSKLIRNNVHSKSFHTNSLKFEEATIELPQKGKVVVPEKIRKIGDDVLSLNVLESMILQQYIRNQVGFDIDIPNPTEAMIKAGLGIDIGGLGGGMAFNPAMMQAMAANTAAPVATEAPKEEAKEEKKEAPVEKTNFNVKLEKIDEKGKISVIKELRKIDKNLSLKAAKELVESAPCVIQKDASKEDAEALKKVLEEMGATVSLE
ncbi:hypothetical protein ABK040_008724 [Willaertia magna]